MSLDNNVVITSNFANDEIQVNKYGNIKKAGTVTFKVNKYEKKMIFSIGQGRYRVE